VPAHLARRFHQICLGVTAEILLHEDLTPMLYGVMAAIQEEPGSGQRHVAGRIGVDAVNLGQMIEFLEQKGLVKRDVDPNDRRARQLYLTRLGTDLRHRLRPSLLAAQQRILAPLAKAERTALVDMLARVIEANDSYARPGNGRRKPRRKDAPQPTKQTAIRQCRSNDPGPPPFRGPDRRWLKHCAASA